MAGAGPTSVFGKKTVIYGRNGAGKTSLSEVLRLAAANGCADSATVTASLFRDGRTRSEVFGTFNFPIEVLVYNRFYVAESLAMFLEGNGTSDPILKIGKKNIEKAAELTLIREVLDRYRLWHDLASKASKSAQAAEREVEKAARDETIEKLSPGDPAKYQTTRYRVDHARAYLDLQSPEHLSPEGLAIQINRACSPALESAGLLPAVPTISDDLGGRVRSALSRNVDSDPIAELVDSPALEKWTEDGVALHDAGAPCKFCHSGTVTEATLATYRRHFSDALQGLRSELNGLVSEAESLSDQWSAWIQLLPASAALLADHKEKYETARAQMDTAVTDLKSAAAAVVGRLKERLADPLTPLSEEAAGEAVLAYPDTVEIDSLLDQNDRECADQDTRKSEAQKAVEEHVGSSHVDKYRAAKERQVVAARCIQAIQRQVLALEQRAQMLDHSQQDTGLMALQIHQDLREHFGHEHLAVAVSEDGKGYVVTRNGAMASDLSEGERNAIAYSYFLSTLDAEGVDPKSTVVVIDDPVTSLDKEALFAAFALAEERTSEFAQTIYLTHDYEFFRLQMNQRKNAMATSQKRIAEGHATEATYPLASVLEMYSSFVPGTVTRVSRLRPLSQKLLQHPSEYHYLFSKVGGAVVAEAGDELPLLGNAARRLFEGFITFRAPQGNNFEQKVEAISKSKGIGPTLSKRVVKFLHGHSHREDPTPATALDFPSIERELRSVLEYMKKADEEHLDNMCKAVGIDERVMAHALTLAKAAS
ncbi:wobble nucleotide-excising tRNase [Frigoribacterium sp. PhB118]|nr:wobble nucleotide-excising tRNase [Frigoribacterium sp. PhB118]